MSLRRFASWRGGAWPTFIALVLLSYPLRAETVPPGTQTVVRLAVAARVAESRPDHYQFEAMRRTGREATVCGTVSGQLFVVTVADNTVTRANLYDGAMARVMRAACKPG